MPTSQTIRLTSGARILRGSKRIGAFLAVPIFLSGAALTISIAYDSAGRAVSAYAQSQCLSQKPSARLFVNQYGTGQPRYRFADNGCPGDADGATETEFQAILAGGAPAFGTTMVSKSFVGLMLSTLAAISIFGVCWGLGWIAAGFTAD